MNNHNDHTGQSSNELYDRLSPDIRAKLSAHEQTSTVPAGERLISHRECPRHLMIVNSGSVEISLPTGKRIVPVAVAAKGKVFGLRTLVSGSPAEIDVTALEECELTLLPISDVLEVLKQHPQMFLAIAQVLSADLKMVEAVLRQRTLSMARRSPALAAG
ncbi:MAG TPA: cyclic nucleotide-binding domain-containing protein [Candidatus Angelobacter sp.]|jgi:CRP-like cAMP-binding protein|nr:cyclic nucleotide-binding domain-containing protein [Candidatus Angelobacter sp.]